MELLVLATDVVMIFTKRVMLSVLHVVNVVKIVVERDILQSAIVEPSQPRRSPRITFVTTAGPGASTANSSESYCIGHVGKETM